ncbi:MAG TPA: aerial mycelium formation protein [Actinomycetes bacterium]|nr:aerial mycelium formation protein [Actinomycetes bacterium]
MSEPLLSPRPDGRRRIDRVLAEDYLDGLSGRSLEDVRVLRHEAEQEEADLSYLRRLLQGRSDLLRAELDRRAGSADEPLVDRLVDVLSDGPRTTHGSGRHITVEPSRVAEHRRRVEQLVADIGLSDVAGRSPEELSRTLAVLEDYERAISELRQRVQAVMDACTSEIARRYRDGEADVSSLLAVEANPEA